MSETEITSAIRTCEEAARCAVWATSKQVSVPELRTFTAVPIPLLRLVTTMLYGIANGDLLRCRARFGVVIE